MDVDALIAQQKAALDKVEPADQEVLLGEQIVTVRLWPLQGSVWRDLTARNPWREGSQFDQSLGYNLDGVVREYPKVYLVQGDDVENVSERWPQIADMLSAPELKALGFAAWGLNEFDPQDRVVKAGKASAGVQRKKRRSPVKSV